jgi:uncharacterized protein
MKEELRKLIKLQEFDSEIYSLQLQGEEIPVIINDLKSQETESKEKLSELKDAAKKLEVEKQAQETEIEAHKQKILKYDSQLYQIKNNDDYKSMLKQIEDTKISISEIEEKTLILMEKLDKISVKTKVAEDIYNEEQQKVKQQEDILNKELSGLNTQIADLKEKSNGCKKTIEKKLLEKYEQILNFRKDSAIAPIIDDSCSACNMVLLPQIVDTAKGGKDLILCDNCSRILYDKSYLNS